MNNKSKTIIELYSLGYKQTNLGKAFNLSRQRIHQITHNYNTINNKIYKDNSKCTCELCNLKFELLHLHHKDENIQNNSDENLMYLCPKCHKIIHLLKQWSRKYTKCIKCGTTKIKHDGLGLCEKCYNKKQRDFKK